MTKRLMEALDKVMLYQVSLPAKSIEKSRAKLAYTLLYSDFTFTGDQLARIDSIINE